MKKYLAVIIPLAIAAPIVLIMIWSAVAPPPTQKVEPAMSPWVAESYRLDRERTEEIRRKQEREGQILKKALEKCEATKIGDAAVVRCVVRETQ
jgi:hypothetical protein